MKVFDTLTLCPSGTLDRRLKNLHGKGEGVEGEKTPDPVFFGGKAAIRGLFT